MEMRRGFTLIELLTVIAIIAVLSAILMPVFVSARQTFQRYGSSNNMRQIAMMSSMYSGDFDEALPPYRAVGFAGPNCDPETQCMNPDYAKAAKGQGQQVAEEWFGDYSRDAIFYYQILWAYGATERLFRCQGNPHAWTGADRTGNSTDIPEYRSYGGQNSYGVNWYLFTNPIGWTKTGGGLLLSQIDRQAETALLIDASYYLVLPRQPGYLLGNPESTESVCAPSYRDYWKNVGNSSLFSPSGPPDDETARIKGEARWTGTIVVVNLDGSSKARKYKDVVTNLQVKKADSYWDPYKYGFVPCQYPTSD